MQDDEMFLNHVPPERLRSLGKQASILHHRRGTPLTEAVTEVLRKHSSLNVEHMKRVTEYANNYAFEEAFQKMSGAHRVIDFEGGPADPAAVVSSLRAEGASHLKVAHMKQDRYIPGLEGVELFYATKNQGLEKRAAAAPANYKSYAVSNTLTSLLGVRDKLASDYDRLGIEYQDASNNMYKEASRLISHGTPSVDVVNVVRVAAGHELLQKLALKTISDRAMYEGLNVPVSEKRAEEVVVNPNSELFQNTKTFVKIAARWFNHAAALDGVNDQIEKLKAELRRGMLQ